MYVLKIRLDDNLYIPKHKERLIIVNYVRRGCRYVNQNEMHVFCSTRLQTLALQWSQKECKNDCVLLFISTFASFFFFKSAGSRSIFKVQGTYSVTCLWFICCKSSLYLIFAGAFCKTVAAWKNLPQKQSDLGFTPLENGEGRRRGEEIA